MPHGLNWNYSSLFMQKYPEAVERPELVFRKKKKVGAGDNTVGCCLHEDKACVVGACAEG